MIQQSFSKTCSIPTPFPKPPPSRSAHYICFGIRCEVVDSPTTMNDKNFPQPSGPNVVAFNCEIKREMWLLSTVKIKREMHMSDFRV